MEVLAQAMATDSGGEAEPARLERAFVARDPKSVGGKLAAARIDRFYFGSEFCEHLLPTPMALAEAAAEAKAAGLALTLTTPLASDTALRRILRLLPQLPEDAEVVCNDWGVAALVGREQPTLRLVAGRQLCKLIKDPRLPSAQWLKLSPHGLASPAFVALLARLRLERLELDVPPFADAELFAGLPLPVHVHTGVGYVAKGRICKIGALASEGPRKFAAGAPCRRECLDYLATTRRDGAATDLATFQDGNTLFYRHSPAMAAALELAVGRGLIRRLIVAAE